MSTFLFLVTATLALTTLAWFANAGPPLQHQPSNPMRFEHVDKSHAEIIESLRLPGDDFRLPGDVVPVNYNLQIRPVLTPDDPDGVAQFRMPGKVRITVECVRSTDVITMHADELDIDADSVTVERTGFPDQPITVTSKVLNPENQSYEIYLAESLVPGTEYDTYIEFVADIPAPEVRMNGIYRSSYQTTEGQTRWVATTQFSRTRALRKTFPSFDEPNQKATFEFTIGRTLPYHTLSNMEIDRSEENTEVAGWFWDFYPRTAKMPGTVIAFVISDFDSEVADPDIFHPDKRVAVWGPPPMLRDGAAVFSSTAVARVLKFFEEHFEIEYEFPKMDSVGMPDFAAGAMENWGLNIYRTTLMFWYEGESTAAAKYSIGDVVAHELAHQWWGNLVTHAWWNDWWLTEGFASYFEYIGFNAADTDKDEPEFRVLNRIVCDDMQTAMDYDAGPGSVPIHGPVSDKFVENPSVINYQKGASLVRMLQGFLGEEAFIGGLKHYLNKRSYTAVHQDALFDDLTEYLHPRGQLPNDNTTMKEILDTWTLQAGYPLVRVSRAGPNTIFVSQERFRKVPFPPTGTASKAVDSPSIQELNPNDLWYIPVGYVAASNPDFSEANLRPKIWLNKNVALTSHSMNTSQWLVLNGDARGYYRVLYDNHFETLLQEQLRTDYQAISVASRSQLVDDYFTLAYQRYIRIGRALEMTRFLRSEREYVVWVPAFKHLRTLSTLAPSLPDEADGQAFNDYIQTIVTGVLQFLGGVQQPGELAFRTISRVPVLDWACTAGHILCIASAVDTVDEWKQNPAVNPVPVDIQATMYCTAVAHAEDPEDEEAETTWDFFLNRYKETPTAAFLNALACSTDEATLQRILTMSITDGSDIPKTSAVAAIQRVAMNSDGRQLVIQFLEDHLADIITYTGDVSSISSIVQTLSQYIANSAQRTRLADFITTNSATLTPIMTQLNEYLGVIDQNIEWMNVYGLDMIAWMKAFNRAQSQI